MKKTKLTTPVVMMAVAVFTFQTAAAQSATDKGNTKNEAKEISKFEKGKIIGTNDLSFLEMLALDGAIKSRGKVEAKKEVTLNGKTFKAGEKLSEEDAALVNKAVAEFNKKHKPAKAEGKARGAADCYYYCYYDYYGNYVCYWYCY